MAKYYFPELPVNATIKSYLDREEPEILRHLELLVDTVSIEETVQQQGETLIHADG